MTSLSHKCISTLIVLVLTAGAARTQDVAVNSCGAEGCDTLLEDHGWVRQECHQKRFGDSFVCECSGSSCDFPGHIPRPADASFFTLVTSSRDEHRFLVTEGNAAAAPTAGAVRVLLNLRYQYQSMLGFGGAFTDSAGLNIVGLSADTQETLLKSYFSDDGIRYNMARVPIAGSDFSTRPYSYDDVAGDVDLNSFALAEEDHLYKLPLIKRAAAVAAADGEELLLLASPWSPPAWMKTNGKVDGSGQLRPELRESWTNYIIKFLDAYTAEGTPLWGITTQNEPMCNLEKEWPFNSCGWTARDMRGWIAGSLGPALKKHGYDNLKVIINDQVRANILQFCSEILGSEEASQYVDGIGVHWYTDNSTNVHLLTETHALFPDKFLLYTEACEGALEPPKGVSLGDWSRAESYAANIIEDTTHFSAGWIDWNLALDMNGGPNWAGNFVDAPIIVDTEHDRFYKQPMFYALGHFSKFVDRGAKAVYNSRIDAHAGIKAATFINPDGSGVAVILNTADEVVVVSVQPREAAAVFHNFNAPPRSIQTLLFKLPTLPVASEH